MSLDFDGFKISVAALVDIHNDLIKEVELIDSMCSRYTVSKARLCLASNIVAIRDTLSKLDNMVEIDNEPITGDKSEPEDITPHSSELNGLLCQPDWDW